MTITRDENGKYPAFAWPGGYPIIYVTDDSGVLCPECANGENGSEASEDAEPRSGWRLEGSDVHWEGEPVTCDHCGKEIESAYGNPDAEPQEPEEGDWTTDDHAKFYSYGKLILSVSVELTRDEMWQAIDAKMAEDKSWPSVWFISDHGNAHLMTR